MATQVQNRRGTTAQHATFTGAVGEVTVDTDKDVVVVHDGATAGGFPLLRENGSQNAVTTGTNTAASFIPTSSTVPANGVYLPAANIVAISTNGTGRLFVDASGNIATGQGTFTKAFTINNANAAIALRAGSAGPYTDQGIHFYVDGTAYSQIYNDGIGQLIFRTGSALSERLRITSDGNVGIGTTSPVSNLHINSGSTSDRVIYIQGSSFGLRLGAGVAGGSIEGVDATNGTTSFQTLTVGGSNVLFNTGGTEKARIDSSGRLLVGTSSVRAVGEGFQSAVGSQIYLEQPSDGLTPLTCVLNRNDANGPRIVFGKSRGTSVGSSTIVQSQDNLGVITFAGADGVDLDTAAANIAAFVDGTPGANDMPGRLVFSTTADGASSPTERMRISNAGTTTLTAAASTAPFIANIGVSEVARLDSSGRLLVGTSTARANFDNATGSAALQVEGTTADTSAAAIIRNSADTSPAALKLVKSRGAGLTSNTLVTAGDSVGAIHFQGNDGTEFVEAARIETVIDATAAANDMPGRIVLSTTLDGASSPTEEWRITNDGVICYNQPAPTTKNAAATLTIAELKTGIINYTGAAATLTLPTGTLTEGGFSGIYTNMTFEWSVINTGSGTCTIGAGTAHTITGAAAVTAGASGRFATRRTAANTFITYRLG